jgi:hypothetical protein
LSEDANVGLLKVNKDGEIEWAKAYSIDIGTYPRDLITTVDGGYAVSGFSINWKAYFLKTDQNGTTGCNDSTLTLFSTNMAAVSESTFGVISEGGNVYDVILTELGTATNIDSTLCENEIGVTSIPNLLDNDHIIVFPNPSKELLTIESEKNIQAARLVSIFGQTVIFLMNSYSKRIEISLMHIPPGLYQLSVKTPNGYKMIPIIRE